MTKTEKQEQMEYVGIDISKSSFDTALEVEGKCVTKRFEYNEEGMQLFSSILPEGVHCVMESTGTYHCRLAHFLHEQGVKVSVLNPLSVKRFAQTLMLRTKTDKKDCQLLLKYGVTFNPEVWEPVPEHYVQLHQMLNLQEQLIKQKTVISNQIEANAYSVHGSKFVKNKLHQLSEQIAKELEEVESEMEKLIRKHDNDNFENLQSIPGIGKKTALVLLTVTQGLQKFSSSKEVCSYFGLCPRIYESGTSIKSKSKICKMGMSQIRKLLYMCALSAKRTNKACKELYQRLLTNGKKKKQALIAVANKLIKQAYAIVKNNQKYNENFLTKFAY